MSLRLFTKPVLASPVVIQNAHGFINVEKLSPYVATLPGNLLKGVTLKSATLTLLASDPVRIRAIHTDVEDGNEEEVLAEAIVESEYELLKAHANSEVHEDLRELEFVLVANKDMDVPYARNNDITDLSAGKSTFTN